MHRNLSKFATVALVAAIALGVPALAKSTHSGKGKAVASLSRAMVKRNVSARSMPTDRSGARRPLVHQIRITRRSRAAAARATTPTSTFTETAKLPL